MTLHKAPFTCEEFKNSIQTVIRPLIDEKDINFVFRMNCGIECIMVDRLRFSQIFFNLLSNAAKFTPAGGTIEFVSERIEPKESDEEGMVGIRMYVRDNGVGMSEEFQTHMYDAFSQETSKIGERSRGTGLGLPIVKSLVEAMNGTIEVKSGLGRGTEFKIELYVELAEKPSPEHYGGIQCYIRLLTADAIAFVADFLIERLIPLFMPVESISFSRQLALACMNTLGALSIRMIYRYAFKCGTEDSALGAFLRWLLLLFAGSEIERSTAAPKKR